MREQKDVVMSKSLPPAQMNGLTIYIKKIKLTNQFKLRNHVVFNLKTEHYGLKWLCSFCA